MGPKSPLSRNLADLLGEMRARDPEAPAVIAEHGTTSFAALDDLSDRVASALQWSGVGSGSTVGLLCTNRIEWFATALGTFKLGARLAAFHTWARGWDLAYMLAHSRCEVLVTLDSFRSHDYLDSLRAAAGMGAGPDGEDGLAALRRLIVIGREDADCGLDNVEASGWSAWLDAAPAAGEPTEHRSAVDEAVVIYTSGTTSRPKAVPLQHFGIVENTFQIGERMGVLATDRVWLPIPLFWSFGGVNAWGVAFTHGAAVVVREAFEPGPALADIERHRATVAYTMPHITNALLAHEDFSPERTASLRTGLAIGSPQEVRRAALELGVPDLCNVYGSTELYGNCTVTPADLPLEVRCECQGPALPGFEVEIVDAESGERRGPGSPGEIRVRGYTTPGYLTPAGYDRGAFDADGYFHTGDVGFLDEDGSLHFQFRDTDMLKVGGINVSPSEIEDFLRSYPGVEEAVVVGLPRDGGELRLVALVVCGTEAASEEALGAYAAENLASFKVPDRILVRDSLPRTSTGKVSRALVRERADELLVCAAGADAGGEEG